jgi:hypothetical protein
MENDRPIKALAAELTDMAAWIENTKPQGVLYDSVLPSMREAAAAITRLEGERDDALKDNKKLRMMMEAREKLQDAFGVDMHQNATETALEFAQREIEAVARAEAAEATLAEATSATMMAEMRADKWKDEVERLKSDVEVALEGWNITRDEMCKLVQYHIDRASAAEAKLQRLQSDVRAALTGDLTNG